MHHARTTSTGEGMSAALEMALLTLRRMAEGGMYDHLGGGFSRYSVDDRWLVPHFEKMLYDNAQLARALPPRVPDHRRPLLRAHRARDPRLPRARDARRGRWLLFGTGRRHRGHRGQVLRLDARGDSGDPRRGRRSHLLRRLRGHRGRQLLRPAPPRVRASHRAQHAASFRAGRDRARHRGGRPRCTPCPDASAAPRGPRAACAARPR